MVWTSGPSRKSYYEHRAKNLYSLSPVTNIISATVAISIITLIFFHVIYLIFKKISQIFCLLDEWCDMSMEDIRKFEDKVKEELDKVYLLIKILKLDKYKPTKIILLISNWKMGNLEEWQRSKQTEVL